MTDPESTSQPTPLITAPLDGYKQWPHTGTAPAILKMCFAAQAYDVPGFLSIPGFVPRPGEGIGYRDWIIDAMLESWGRVANIELDFYDSCPSSNPPSGWVEIHFNDPNHTAEEASPGFQPDGHNTIWLNQNQGQKLPPSNFDHHACGNLDTQPKPPKSTGEPEYDALEKLRNDAMHELGHTLGFAHNGLDPDKPDGLGCTMNEDLLFTDNSSNDFDYDSVMDYCTHPCTPDFWGNKRPYYKARLSDWDVLNAQQVYGTKYASGTSLFVGHRNSVIELPTGATSGTQLEVWDYKAGLNEHWNFLTNAHVQSAQSTALVWDVRGGTTSPTAGTPIQLNVSLSQLNQQFKLGGVELRGTGDNCLQATSKNSGAAVELVRCKDVETQHWDVDYGTTATKLRLAGTSFCIASASSTPANGQALRLENCVTAGARSAFAPRGNGQLGFAGKCLDVATGAPHGLSFTNTGAPRSLDTYDTSYGPIRGALALQLFTCKAAGSSQLNQVFHARGPITGLNGQCVDIRGGTAFRGAPVQLFKCTGNPNQIWDAYVF